jgi:Zn-dependent peptidase ImmA (M78 family)
LTLRTSSAIWSCIATTVHHEEREANQFASALLMPAADIHAHAPRFPTLRDLVRAKRRWRVSAAALNYRLHDLGLIDHWHYQSLCVEISRIGRDREIDSIPREKSTMLSDVLAMLREDGVSQAQIATDLHVHPRELSELIFGLVLTQVDGGGDSPGGSSPAVLRLVTS